MKDSALIDAIYDERSRGVNVYFARSSQAEKAALLRRFAREREDALKMLEAGVLKNRNLKDSFEFFELQCEKLRNMLTATCNDRNTG